MHIGTQTFVHIGYNKIHIIHTPWMLPSSKKWLSWQLRCIYPAQGCIHSLHSTQPTLHYHIIGYPMVSLHAPTYFYSCNNTHIHWLKPTCIYPADVTVTNRTPCQGTTIWITDLCLITGQFQDHLRDQLQDQLQDHLRLISNSISDPISGQLCDHHYDCPRDCLYDCLIDHLHLITSKLCDQLCGQFCIPNSNIAKALDPGLGL